MTDRAYAYTKLRSNFGRQPLFCEFGPEMCDSISFNAGEAKNYILRNPVCQFSQNTRPQSANEINTIRPEYASTSMNHAEGGWPKDVNCLDPEATQRYRRKTEKDDNYIHCVFSTAEGMEHYMNQNNAIDIYTIYYNDMAAWPPVEHNILRTVNVYKDPECRPISSINWEPEGGTRFAVTYADVDYYRMPLHSVDAHLWNVENTNTPEMVLLPPCTMYDLQFNPRDTTTLVGGLGNGQVAVFDRRNGQSPVSLCPLHEAHRDLVRNVIYINSKSGQEFFSGGPDGACKWWDTRNMSEPTEVMIIDVVKYSFEVQSMANAFGISVLQYEPTIPTRFMVGTENGHVILGNRKGKTPQEKLPGMGALAAVGSSKGNIYMVEMSTSMQSSEKNDKSLMQAVLERESKREKILEARLREIRLKQRQAEDGSPKHSELEFDPLYEKDLIEATNEYNSSVKKNLKLFDYWST